MADKRHKKALVFGGAGFLGSYVADALSDRGYRTTIFDRNKSRYLRPHQEFILGDILDLRRVSDAVKGYPIVYNFSGLADINAAMARPLEAVQLNILGNTHILEACRQHSVQRFVYASSAYAFSAKGSFYGVSKHASEKLTEEYANQFGLKYTIVRYGSVYGERADDQNRIYRLIKQAMTEKRISFQGNGEEEREYIHARDAAALSVDILDKAYANEHIILTGIERFKYRELLNMIKEILNHSIKIDFLNQDYKGHYEITPYSFHPVTSKKMVNNPYIDMGQGLLEIVAKIHDELKKKDRG